MDTIIGVDFDNTLVSYDDLMYQVALDKELIKPDTKKSKETVRNKIRQLPNGEIKWQEVQAIVYGAKMGEASLIDGVRRFFELCKGYQFKVFIVSHKSEFARRDQNGTNLRSTALAWMEQNGFFENDKTGLTQANVYFESTRREKVERVKQLQCTHFIDDLEETFLEASFPASVEQILYAPHKLHTSLSHVKLVTSWKEITDCFFNANG